MCAVCVAQGIGYVGGALGYLQVKSARISARRRSKAAAGPEPEPASPSDNEVPVSIDA